MRFGERAAPRRTAQKPPRGSTARTRPAPAPPRGRLRWVGGVEARRKAEEGGRIVPARPRPRAAGRVAGGRGAKRRSGALHRAKQRQRSASGRRPAQQDHLRPRAAAWPRGWARGSGRRTRSRPRLAEKRKFYNARLWRAAHRGAALAAPARVSINAVMKRSATGADTQAAPEREQTRVGCRPIAWLRSMWSRREAAAEPSEQCRRARSAAECERQSEARSAERSKRSPPGRSVQERAKRGQEAARPRYPPPPGGGGVKGCFAALQGGGI